MNSKQHYNYQSINGVRGKIRFGFSSFAAKKRNEDTFDYAFYKNMSFFVIFDGHNGNQISEYCRDNFIRFLQRKIDNDSDLLSSDTKINKAFLEFDNIVEKYWNEQYAKMEIKPRLEPGTTLVAVILVENPKRTHELDVVYLHLGDSYGFVPELVHFTPTGNGLEECPHKTRNKVEMDRILNAGGREEVLYGYPYVTHEDSPKYCQMTRSFGNFTLKKTKGLPPEKQTMIAVPMIKRKKFDLRKFGMEKRNPFFIALYSDGAGRFGERHGFKHPKLNAYRNRGTIEEFCGNAIMMLKQGKKKEFTRIFYDIMKNKVPVYVIKEFEEYMQKFHSEEGLMNDFNSEMELNECTDKIVTISYSLYPSPTRRIDYRDDSTFMLLYIDKEAEKKPPSPPKIPRMVVKTDDKFDIDEDVVKDVRSLEKRKDDTKGSRGDKGGSKQVTGKKKKIDEVQTEEEKKKQESPPKRSKIEEIL